MCFIAGERTWKLVTHVPRLEPGRLLCHYVCSCNHAIQLSSPELFDMTSDPGETSPFSTSSKEFKQLVPIMLDAIQAHEKSIGNIDSQFSWHKIMWRPDLQPCCNGTFPFCYCFDEKYPE